MNFRIIELLWRNSQPSLGPGSALGEKVKKKSAWVKNGGERVAEPGDMPLMPPIRTPTIN